MMRCFSKSLFVLTVGVAGILAPVSSQEQPHPSTPGDSKTDIWVIKTTGPALTTDTAKTLQAINLGPVGSLKGYYQLDFSKSQKTEEEITKLLDQTEGVLWFERQIVNLHLESEDIPGEPTDDPAFGNAWHLSNAGQSNGRKGEDLNLIPAWDWGLDGTGNLIAVIDEGTQLDHPDLTANIRADLARDFIATGTNANKLETDENHGTAVSGIIAATDNDIGSVGVAYGAHLVPIRYIGVSHTDNDSAQALTYMSSAVSIYNNSWGPATDEDSQTVGLSGALRLGKLALAEGTTSGRNGRGNIYVFAAGNDNQIGANVNYNSWANSRYTIAVAALGNKGTHSDYSEMGAPILVAAPSGGQSLGIFTTDRTGADGYVVQDFYSSFSGTSAATPMVSGVVALMLQANPQLGWRDVQHILAKTAVTVDPEDEGWRVNGAGLTINDKYGFGRVDASAAVQTASNWINVGEEQSTSGSRSANLIIPDSGSPISSTITLSRNLKIENVEIIAELNHSDWGDLEITIVSPAGTESLLAEPHNDTFGRYSSWTYTSVQFMDETSQGRWTLQIRDRGNEGVGSLTRWSLRVYGTAIETDSNQSPVATADDYMTTTYPATLQVLSNDSEPDGDALNIISLYQPAYGSLNITENSDLVYTPDEDTFLGIDRFGYTISDSKGGVASTQVNITHPGPVAISDQAVVVQGRSVSIPVLINDFDRSNDEISLLSVSEASSGVASVQGESVVYTPNQGFIGNETLTYTITDNNDGENTGSIRVFTSGDSDFGLLFDGIDDFVKFDHNNAFNITSAITIESAFYLRSYGENDTVGFGRIIDRDTYSLLVNGTEHQRYPDNSLVFAVELPNGSTATANTPANTIKLNRWHRVAVTYDQQNVTFYIDGKEVETEFKFDVEFTGPLASKTADLFIGENEAGTRAFDGIIDWVRVWNKTLLSTQIETYGLFVPQDERNGLIGWFQFNEGFGWSTIDSMGNGGNGIISEALWVPKDPSMLGTAITSSQF